MLDKIKELVHQEIEMLFAETTTCQLTNDVQGYNENLTKVTEICRLLNIPVQTVSTNIVLIETIKE